MPQATTITKNEAEVGLRAYRIWEAEGKPHGKDFDHWLKAEAELMSEVKPAHKRATPKNTAKASPKSASAKTKH